MKMNTENFKILVEALEALPENHKRFSDELLSYCMLAPHFLFFQMLYSSQTY
jgi:hypothetical protein